MAMPDVEVSIAFDSGYLTPASSRTWTNVSTYVEAHQNISIQRGRPDQFGTVQASRCQVTFDNRDGRFTPEYAAGAYYPNVKKGRPIRVRARWVAGSGTWYTLFTGYVDEWPVVWPGGSQRMSTVTVTATSRMARLGRSAEFKSIVEEEILDDGPVLYFPLGEPAGSLTAGNIAPGRSDVLSVVQIGGVGGTLEFGAGIGPGTDDLTAPVFTPAGTFGPGLVLVSPLAEPLTLSSGTVIELECFVNMTTAPTDMTVVGLNVGIAGIAPMILGVQLATGKPFFQCAIDASNSFVVGATSIIDGLTHHIAGRVTLAGTTLTSSIVTDGGTRVTDATPATYTGPPVQYRYLSVGGSGETPWALSYPIITGTVAHVVVRGGTVSTADARITAHAQAGLTGFEGEASGARVARYARLAGVPTAEVSTETGLSTSIAHKDTTGDSPLSLMEAVTETEDGVLFDAGDGTLTFQARSHRYVATSAFTLDCDGGDIEADYRPTLDDQHMVNDMKASRPNGVTVRSVNQASITEHGYYRETLEVLTTSDSEVQSHADWAVNRFGTPRVTVPDVSVDLTTCSSAKITSLLAADIGTRFTVSNLPTQAPTATADYFVEGITYDIGVETFQVSFNTSAAAYASVWMWDSATQSQWDQTTVFAY